MSSRLRAGAGSPMASAGSRAPGPLTLRLGYSAAAVAASPPSGDSGGGLRRASPGGRGGGGPAGGPTHRLTGASARSPQPEPPDSPAQARTGRAPGGWTRERDASAPGSPPPRRRHLRAGAGERARAKGARKDRATARAWRAEVGGGRAAAERAHRPARVRTRVSFHSPVFCPFSPPFPSSLAFDAFPSLFLLFRVPSCQSSHPPLFAGEGGRDSTPVLLGGLLW